MTSRKNIWDTLDELEGKKKGSSYSNLQKERVRQGYSEEVNNPLIKSKTREGDKYPDSISAIKANSKKVAEIKQKALEKKKGKNK